MPTQLKVQNGMSRKKIKSKKTNRPFKKYKHTDNILLSKTIERHTNATMKGNHLHCLYIFIYIHIDFFNKHCVRYGVRMSTEYIGQEQDKGLGL